MPYISTTTVSLNIKEKGMEAIEARVDTGPNHISQVPVTIVGPIMCPESARLMVKNVITATSKDIQSVLSFQATWKISWIQCEKFIPEQ